MAALSRKEKQERRFRRFSNVYIFIVYAILYLPVAMIMIYSFNDQKNNYYWNGFTTKWYAQMVQNGDLIDSLIYTLIIAVLATVISVVIGTIGAIGLKKFEFKFKKVINNVLYIPIIVPEIVMAVAILIIFMKIGISLGMGAILIGHCTFCIPYVVVTIKGRISGDNDTLQEASMDLGANRIQTFFRVTLPTIFPGVMSAAFLSFTLSFDDVVMSQMLAGAKHTTLPVLILSKARTGISPDVNALMTIVILIIIAVVVVNILRDTKSAKKKAQD